MPSGAFSFCNCDANQKSAASGINKTIVKSGGYLLQKVLQEILRRLSSDIREVFSKKSYADVAL